MQAKHSNHGGRRNGSGRPSFFRGKSAKAEKPLYKSIPAAMELMLTPEALTLMLTRCKELSHDYAIDSKNPKARVSRNEFVEGLIRVYGSKLTLSQIKRVATE